MTANTTRFDSETATHLKDFIGRVTKNPDGYSKMCSQKLKIACLQRKDSDKEFLGLYFDLKAKEIKAF